jgi:hypothetical protein
MSGVKELGLYFISDPRVVTDYDGALASEAAIVKDSILVKDIDDLIRRIIQACIARGARVKHLVIASHGNSDVFSIGENRLFKGDPRLWKLAALRGFFTQNAVVVINACECGQNQEFMRKIALILGATVIAYTGDIDVYKWWSLEGIVPHGSKVICTASGCREMAPGEEWAEAFQRGPGEPPGWAREI